jgi:hypothetical protein
MLKQLKCSKVVVILPVVLFQVTPVTTVVLFQVTPVTTVTRISDTIFNLLDPFTEGNTRSNT